MNRAKFKALAHHIIAKSDPSRLGTIRLNKILFYVDTAAFRATGKSLTGETYIKRQFGPVPKNILKVLGELEQEGAIVVRDHDRYGDRIRHFMSMKEPNLAAVSAEDLALVDDMRAYICDNFSASAISQVSHDQVWEAANIGEVIPLEATLASQTGEITKDVRKWATSVVSRYEAAKKAA
jgi:hypothetical protein